MDDFLIDRNSIAKIMGIGLRCYVMNLIVGNQKERMVFNLKLFKVNEMTRVSFFKIKYFVMLMRMRLAHKAIIVCFVVDVEIFD